MTVFKVRMKSQRRGEFLSRVSMRRAMQYVITFYFLIMYKRMEEQSQVSLTKYKSMTMTGVIYEICFVDPAVHTPEHCTQVVRRGRDHLVVHTGKGNRVRLIYS